jgi:hypothetical protein
MDKELMNVFGTYAPLLLMPFPFKLVGIENSTYLLPEIRLKEFCL